MSIIGLLSVRVIFLVCVFFVSAVFYSLVTNNRRNGNRAIIPMHVWGPGRNLGSHRAICRYFGWRLRFRGVQVSDGIGT